MTCNPYNLGFNHCKTMHNLPCIGLVKNYTKHRPSPIPWLRVMSRHDILWLACAPWPSNAILKNIYNYPLWYSCGQSCHHRDPKVCLCLQWYVQSGPLLRCLDMHLVHNTYTYTRSLGYRTYAPDRAPLDWNPCPFVYQRFRRTYTLTKPSRAP